jgi:hypothetical protein
MAVKEIKVNYHSYLNEIKSVLDPVVNKMRTQSGQPWRRKAWTGPLKVFTGYFKQAKILKAVQWSTLPIIGPIVAAVAAGNYGNLPIWLCITVAILLIFGVYYLFVRSYANKMATIGDPNFHVEAFKIRRPSEFAIWAQFVNKPDFTFEGLYDIVNTVFSQNNHDPSSISHVVAYSQGQHEFMQRIREEQKNTIIEQEEVIAQLEDDLVESENAVTYLVGIIKKVSENLYRYVNGRLEFSDMDFVSGFTLYHKRGNSLVPFWDKGTSGRNRSLDLSNDKQYAAVAAANDDNEQAHYNNPYPGRHIVAFRMTMLEGEMWVWCFHFDDDDDRALSLLYENDIIETRQIRRVIHAFCLTLQKRMISQKEVDQNAEAN